MNERYRLEVSRFDEPQAPYPATLAPPDNTCESAWQEGYRWIMAQLAMITHKALLKDDPSSSYYAIARTKEGFQLITFTPPDMLIDPIAVVKILKEEIR